MNDQPTQRPHAAEPLHPAWLQPWAHPAQSIAALGMGAGALTLTIAGPATACAAHRAVRLAQTTQEPAHGR